MIATLQGCTRCIAHHAPLTKRIIAACPELRLFVVCRGGPVNANLVAATEAGILAGFTPGRNATATEEFTSATALAAVRGIHVWIAASVRRPEIPPMPRPVWSWRVQPADWSAMVPFGATSCVSKGLRGQGPRLRSVRQHHSGGRGGDGVNFQSFSPQSGRLPSRSRDCRNPRDIGQGATPLDAERKRAGQLCA